MIFLIFLQYMKHRMQIMQERWEYDLMTNSVKFMQQTTLSLSEADRCVCNNSQQSTYLINCSKIEARDENIYLWYKHRLTDVCAIYSYEFHHCLLQPVVHINHPLLQFTDIMHPFSALLHCFPDFIDSD